ncbi:hypothetical protein DBY21_04485 [Candidatus Gastranaerophilales bacterium]|nr:MAG: hypothetical protein DBY21_04485 [Candidatus Gastranaerophilales bacterium]
MKKNIFDLYMNKLLELPLWIKQAIYVKLKEDIKKRNCAKILEIKEEDLFALYKPILTYNGRTELTQKNCGLDVNMYSFLNLCNADYSILEIALSMYLTMEEVAKYFIFCVEQKYLERPESDEAYAMAGFISGKFKTGEYFMHNQKLSFNQVQSALTEQSRINSSGGTRLKYAQILDSMNLIDKNDTEMIFTLQEEAKKRFILDYTSAPTASRAYMSLEEKSSEEVEKLKEENKMLKEKLVQLLKIVRKDV